MVTIKFLPMALLLFFVLSCATSNTRQWVKPDTTAQELYRADYECQKQALLMTRAYGAGPANKGWVLGNYHDSCMRADGWEPK